MDREWTDGERLCDAFPGLARIADLSLASPRILSLAVDPASERALRRVRAQCSTCADLLALTHRDIRNWRGVGEGKLREISAFLTSLGQASLAFDDTNADGYVGRHSSPDPALPPPLLGLAGADPAAATVASWVRTVTGGTTWADVLAATRLSRPDDVSAAWTALLASEVVAGDAESAGMVIDRFVDTLTEPRRIVLLRRALGPERQKLQELGDQLGVTRERARQLETQVSAELRRNFDDSEDWRTVRWAVDALRQKLGAFAPTELRQSALPGISEQARRVVTWLADYRYEDEYVVAGGFEVPSASDMPVIASGGTVVDEFELHETLSAAGVRAQHADALIARVPGLARVDGQLVLWGSAMTDKAAAVLEVRDEPQDVEELFQLAGGGSLTSFRNRIYEDPRFMRATKSKVALRAWGGSYYTSVTDLMAQRLASGPMEIAELARELHTTYEVSEHSVAMYAYAPMFKITGETVGLRSERDPFVPRAKPYSVRGLYRIGTDTVIWHVDVDQDVLRGSGRSAPQEIGTFLGLQPGGETIELANSVEQVPFSWLVNSITGPNIGSIRAQTESVAAGLGDVLRLRFTTAPPALAIERVQPAFQMESPAMRIQRLTGLGLAACGDAGALGYAVWTNGHDLAEVLRKRGDVEIAEAAEAL